MALRNFLIVYNWKESRLDHWRDLDREVRANELSPSEARQLYREYEKRYRQADGFEVVLIGSDSIETVRQTHSHYFGTTPLERFEELLTD